MTATVAGIHLGLDTHANRPAANTAPAGSLYSCSTHSKIYKTDGSSTWSDYANLSGTGETVAASAIWTTAGKVAVATGTATATEQWPVGRELDYVEKTSSVTPTATTEATADVIVTSNSVTFDGTACWFEFYCAGAASPAGVFMLILLYDNTASTSASVGRLGNVTNPSGDVTPIMAKRKLSPSAGARIFSVRAIVSSGTGALNAGAGGAATYMPMFLRITKA